MIKLEHVSKSYSAGIPALNDVNLEIEDGEFVFIVGSSGSGKSTLIKLLLKELEPTEGSIVINGKQLRKIRRRHIPKFRRNIGCVFQDFRLLKNMTVFENVAFGIKHSGRENIIKFYGGIEKIKEEMNNVFTYVDRIDDLNEILSVIDSKTK